MKILYIIDYGTVGGATHSFLEMVTSLKLRGISPVIFFGKKTNITELLDKKGIEYYVVGHRTVLEPLAQKGLRWPYVFLKKAVLFWKQEKKALKRIDCLDLSGIDLIHTNSARNDIGCFVSKKYDIPHIMHIREFADADFDCISFRPNYINLYNRNTSLFISISNAVKKHWVKKGLNENKILTIYNGIYYENISVSTDESKKSSKLHLFIAGGVGIMKGQHLAVKALGLLPENVRKNLSLDIAGWGNDRYIDEMKTYATKNGYSSKIHFLGSIDDVHERMGNYQIGLMCSRAEGFGRVTAEYMHGRLGVVASDSGANPELIEDGVTGLLFKSGDAKSLADCIVRLYNDRELLIRLSNAAQKKARALYTQQKNADAIYELYKEILNQK